MAMRYEEIGVQIMLITGRYVTEVKTIVSQRGKLNATTIKNVSVLCSIRDGLKEAKA